ncbi:type I polyketide synthase [Streptomyces profundus]|uniref:type I polyketide synthase n=1 Tax=Streptomyces profundus TaxID=2867410 RepID=UPI001D1629C6|nr:type I polyketide synthase [Streptomyces sp. MA3_2.13]
MTSDLVNGTDAIAITGLSCRLPQAPDGGAFWELLRAGRSAITEVPPGRWDADALLPDAPERHRAALRHGGFLDEVDRFDAGFFGISPREAVAIDPQQRLFAELAWEALEDAGIVPGTLRGTATGVVVGATAGDYAALAARGGAVTQHSLPGLNRGVIANRVSYALGLRGPSLTVDSAQSSSLVAVHLAVESLRRGESTLALAGGVALNLAPESAEVAGRFGGLSPDGRCFTFDARANGYVRGEGGGVVVLKPLAHAVRDGDRVYGVILGGAVNNDGATEGLTVPSAEAQAEVVRRACADAGVDPALVRYVELHGTGTPTGDPLEAAGVGAVYGRARPAGSPVIVGSAKTNVGHLEGAAGIVGLIKTALSLRHREIPASLNYAAPHPEIDVESLNLRVQTEAGPWPDAPLVAGVSSFGVGGTNCHLVLAEAPEVTAPTGAAGGPAVPLTPWPVSGRTDAALRAQAGRLRERRGTDADPFDVGWSLAMGRTHFERRAVAIGPDHDAQLAALSAGEAAPGLVTGTVGEHGGIALVFPGQGSQWAGMARELLATSAVFRASVDACEAALSPHVEWSLAEVLAGAPDAPPLDRADVLQPTLFVVMVSLARVWESLGVRPDAVVGHSQGEVAAAHIAGALDLADAARIVSLRSRTIRRLAGTGAMASVPLPADEVARYLAPFGEAVSVAAVNGPGTTVVAGTPAAVAEVVARAQEDGVRAKAVPAVDFASHSPHMEAIREPLLEQLSGVAPRAGGTTFYSTVTGTPQDGAGLDADYWYTNLRQPVLFEATLRAMADAGFGTFVEVSPHPVLTQGLRETLPEALVVGSLRRESAPWPRLLTSLAELHVRGVPVDWSGVFAGRTPDRVPLPTYAFQRARHWPESVAPTAASGAPLPPVAAPEPVESERASWPERFAGLAAEGRARAALELVRLRTALVLGHLSWEDVDADRAFRDLGLDSTLAVQLRQELAEATGLALPDSLVFDHPSPTRLAHRLAELALGEEPSRIPAAPTAPPAPVADDPIVIVGMACRFPGGVGSPEELWRLVEDGVDAISSFPDDRGWDLDGLYAPEPGVRGRTYTRHGGFLDDVAAFDAEFFGISPREATAMDPQQRLLLQVAWEAFERAGIAPDGLRGSGTGVFVGAMSQEYGPRLHEGDEGLGGYLLTGTTASVASGRLAYTFGLQGPAVTVDTACSSSLVALHQAAQALRAGECSLALAGGVTVMATPGMFVEFGQQRGLAPDGRCRSFAASAGGTSWGEGAGVVLLERLSDARRAGHPVLAVVRGSAINQDGASNGLTAPNGPAQQGVIQTALAGAGLSPDQVDAVEGHGTGTSLGDPIEAQALLATYGQGRSPDEPLWLGSLKSNIGHAQAAAGVAGVIKMVQAIRHGTLPKTLHVDEPSPRVDWDAGGVRLLTEARAWPETGRPRRAAISSFGISGTNAHLILEAPPAPEEPAAAPTPAGHPVPWVLSAASAEALGEQAARLRAGLASQPGLAPGAIGHALARGRARLPHRAVVVAADRAEFDAALTALTRAEPTSALVRGTARDGATAFLFTGQGSQRLGMGRELAETFPVFAAALDEVCELLGPEVRAVMWGDEEALGRTEFTQPAIFAVEVALFRLFASWGVRPDVVAGHSIGELAAAQVAGVFSLPDAARLVRARGRLMGALPRGGAMVAVEATEEEVLPLLTAGVGLAAVNGPASVVISGVADEVDAVLLRLGERRTNRLTVSHAFHSPLMDPMVAEFREVAGRIAYAPPRIPVVAGGEVTDPEYWVQHVRATVRFADTVTRLEASGVTRCLELGPDAVLTPMARAALAAGPRPATLVPTLHRDRAEPRAVLTALGRLHADGVAVDWAGVFGPGPAPVLDLPTYPFQERRYWLRTPRPTGGADGLGLTATGHPLLTTAVELPDSGGLLLTGRIAAADPAWVPDHAVFDTPVLPGVAFLDMLLHAAARVGSTRVAELTHHAFLAPPPRGALQLRVHLRPANDAGLRTFAVHARPEGADPDADWTCHVTGTLGAADEPAEVAPAPAAWPPPGAHALDTEGFYAWMAGAGLRYGPAFQGLRAAWRDGDTLYAEVELPAGTGPGGYGVHPALLDSALHPLALAAVDTESDGTLQVPFAWSGVTLHAGGARALRVRLAKSGQESVALLVTDQDGAPVLSVDSLAMRAVSPDRFAPTPATDRDGALHEVVWRALPAGAAEAGWEVPALGAGPVPVAPGVFAAWCLPQTDTDPVQAAHDVLRRTLALAQEFLTGEETDARLVLLTRGAVSTDTPDLATAALWGLIRSAQSEHPGRFTLLDLDDSAPSLVAAPGEPQLALCDGQFLVPRIARTPAGTSAEGATFTPGRTVLITGGTGALGALLARHLVTRHGVDHLLLTSRSGPEGAGTLAQELTDLGAHITITACDTTDPHALTQLLDTIPDEHPLGSVIHCAGVLDDATLTTLTPERLTTVLRPKIDAAWNLHHATKHLTLDTFILYSSAVATLGSPGQANYAAANAFLDALATHRHTQDLPATSLAWGLWQHGMATTLNPHDLHRMTRNGLHPMPAEQALALFDAALRSDRAVLVPASLGGDPTKARPLLAELAPAPKPRSDERNDRRDDPGADAPLRQRLAALPEADQREVLLTFLGVHAGAVLGHEGPLAMDPEKPFKELGFDSLSGIELLIVLSEETGLHLPSTMLFDHPTPEALISHLRDALVEEAAEPPAPAPAPVASATVVEERINEPIAIVGMACRFPGGANSPDALWQLVMDERDAVGPFPDNRGWDLDHLFDPDPDARGRTYASEGGFLYDADRFDPEFFGISPREALALDPQQRLLLETAWETFEHAGIDPTPLRGSATGVFAGVVTQEYGSLVHRGDEPVDGFLLTGTTASVASGRIAYTLGFEGPAVTIDTACSSSLVALHMACQSLRNNESTMALAGGATIMANPGMFLEFSRQRGLAPDSRCKSFSNTANGVAWAEGAGMILLERLTDAQQHGHPILATIQGTAINQDGASNGLTAPNGPAQQRVIHTALTNAGLTPNDIDAIEAHGTGTPLGDPIEAQALHHTYGQHRTPNNPLYLGSLKSNIGHAQAAAGIGGIIKTIQAIRHATLPKTLHINQPTPHIDWTNTPLQLLTHTQPWPHTNHPRRAAVSSFGISGTNAHIILQQAPPAEPETTAPDGDQPVPDGAALAWVLSARSQDALRAQAERLRQHLTAHPEARPEQVGQALTTGRSLLPQRAVLIADGPEGFDRALEALGRGEPSPALVRGAPRPGKTAFLFTGQGAQRAGMGRQLYDTHPVFREAFDEVCAALDHHLDTPQPLKKIVFGNDQERLNQTGHAQAALFAVETALHRLVASFGITPDYLAGHSVGEIAAAHAAGVLSLDDASRLVAARGTLMQALPPGGAMVSLRVGEDEVLPLLAGREHEVALAAVNGPASVVVSGTGAATAEIAEALAERGVRTRRLAVSHAFHSPLMEPMLAEFARVAGELAFHRPNVPVVSNLTGRLAEPGEIADPAYWVRHVREAVRFADGVTTLHELGVRHFLELGPDGTLTTMAQDSLDEDASESTLVASLHRERDEDHTFLAALGTLHAHGVPLSWAPLFGTGRRPVLDLPTYAFQRQRYWLDASVPTVGAGGLGLTATGHPVLSTVTELPDGGGHLFTGRVSGSNPAWVAEHAIFGAMIVPGVAFVDLLLHVAGQVGCDQVEELTHHVFLAVPERGALQLRVLVESADETGRRPLAVYSRPEVAPAETSWTCHATGALAPGRREAPATIDTLADQAWPPAAAEPVDTAEFYRRIVDAGFGYGPLFRSLDAAWRDGDITYAEVALPTDADTDGYGIHPGLLDSALQPAALVAGDAGTADTIRVPFSWSGVSLHATGARALRIRLAWAAQDTLTLVISDQTGAPVMTIDALVMRAVGADQLAQARAADAGELFAVDWASVPAPSGAAEAGWEVPALGAGPVPVAPGVFAAWCLPQTDTDPVQAAHDVLRRTLALAQEFLTGEETDARLVLLTRGAISTDTPDLATAALWGLIRSAQSEHPDRLVLVDLDETPDSLAAVPASLATEEPQLALRDGHFLAPRIARTPAGTSAEGATFTPGRTVLITGGTGALGALLARHLVTRHGVDHLLLTSRSGPEGAGTLAQELTDLGAHITITACDTTDPHALTQLLDTIPDEHPLGSVIHCAGVLDDATLTTLTPERLTTVLRPKIDAAWNLHHATKHLTLDTFILYSSAVATLGSPGQANYAAANAFLDALATHRHTQDLPATSLAWGLWQHGMATTLNPHDLHRMTRNGLHPMPTEQALALFDAALDTGRPVVVPAKFDLAGLRARASSAPVPALFRGLVRAPVRGAALAQGSRAAGGGLRESLAGRPEREQIRVIVDFLRGQMAGVLGHGSPDAIDAASSFRELGFDSLSSVELRNALNKASGMRLPSTLLFDYPTPAVLARHIQTELAGAEQPAERAPRAQVTPRTAPDPTHANEPIAVVGMACRFPGGANSPDELWQLVMDERDAVGPFPDNRGWDLDHLFDPDPDARGRTYASEGGFLYDADRFDPEFFGISPREALALDPQQRLLLETAWETFEHAGIDPTPLRGSATGVFAGVAAGEYVSLTHHGGEPVEGYLLTGTTASVASGRIAYTFGFEGPAVTIDTACSSSLVALHMACQSLRNNESTMALAGGATIMANPGMFLEFSRQRGLAPDSRCKSFSNTANGVAWAEGAGMILLERLTDAQQHGHPILATIQGTAINQDGASNGLTAPNGPAQQRVIHTALTNAGLTPNDIDAIEAHGTGTPLGDPIEAQALHHTYGQHRTPNNPLYLGSLKSNIGHAQAAAGIGGIIKTIQAIRHATLPKTLHINQPTPHIDWTNTPLQLLTHTQPWPHTNHPRRAAVSSFGISGTNAHVILQQAPTSEEHQEHGAESAPRGPVPWVLSARSEDALRAQARRLLDHVTERPELRPAEVAHALATSRTTFEHHAVAVGGDRDELLAGLRTLASDPTADLFPSGPRAEGVAFLFTGQGAQRAGMGRQLYDTHPVFREAFDEVCAALDHHLDTPQPLRDIVFGDDQEQLDQTGHTQPALFAFQTALYRLVASLGVIPGQVIGHSVGEIAAAHAAGVLSLDDASRLVAARGTLMQALPPGGAMVAVEATEEEVAARLTDGVSVAAVNGPRALMVSGDEAEVAAIADEFAALGRRTRRLRVSHAFHSPRMEPMLDAFRAVAEELTYRAPEIPFVSTVTGRADAEPTSAAYWTEQIRATTRFHDGLVALQGEGVNAFLEIGPDAVLTALAREALPQAAAVPLVLRGQDEPAGLVRGLARAHAHGVALDWSALLAGGGARRVDLPTYAFQRRRYWLERQAPAGSPGGLGLEGTAHPLLATATELPDGTHLFTGRVALSTHPWLGDHVVMGTVILPGTAFVELAFHAALAVGQDEIAELVLNAPVTFGSRGAVLLQVVVGPEDRAGGRTLTLRSRAEEDHSWTENATGTLGGLVPAT